MTDKEIYSRISQQLALDSKASKIGVREIENAVNEATSNYVEKVYAISNDGKLIMKDKIMGSSLLPFFKQSVIYTLIDMLQGTSKNCMFKKPLVVANSYSEQNYPLGVELPSDVKFVIGDNVSVDTTSSPNVISRYGATNYTHEENNDVVAGGFIRQDVPTEVMTAQEYRAIQYNTLRQPYHDKVIIVSMFGGVRTALDNTGLPIVKGTSDFRSAKYSANYYIDNNVANGNIKPKGEFKEDSNIFWIITGQDQVPIRLEFMYIKTHLNVKIDLTGDTGKGLDLPDHVVYAILDMTINILTGDNVPEDAQYQVTNNTVQRNDQNMITEKQLKQ